MPLFAHALSLRRWLTTTGESQEPLSTDSLREVPGMNPDQWSRVKSIVNECLDLPQDQRVAHLDSSCAGDSEIRAEVESLLENYSQAGDSFLETSIPLGSDNPVAPKLLGIYQVIEQIGEGELGRLRIDSLQIYDPLFKLSLRHLAIACTQAVFMALSGDPFYAVIIPVHRMTVKRRDSGDFDQELPGTSLLFRHVFKGIWLRLRRAG